MSVLWLETPSARVAALNQCHSYVKQIEWKAVAAMTTASKFWTVTDFARVVKVEAVIICVPTPFNKHREPDITCICYTGHPLRHTLEKAHWWSWNP